MKLLYYVKISHITNYTKYTDMKCKSIILCWLLLQKLYLHRISY